MFFHSKRSDNTKKNLHRQWNWTYGLKNKILHCFKRRHCQKLCCEQKSQSYICVTFTVVVVDLQTDCILSFHFPAETDVLAPVFSQSTDVVVGTSSWFLSSLMLRANNDHNQKARKDSLISHGRLAFFPQHQIFCFPLLVGLHGSTDTTSRKSALEMFWRVTGSLRL